MDVAKVFQTGRSQAIRLPKAYRLKGTEVYIKHMGRGVLLIPKDDPWSIMVQALSEFEPGFRLEREQPAQSVREEIAD